MISEQISDHVTWWRHNAVINDKGIWEFFHIFYAMHKNISFPTVPHLALYLFWFGLNNSPQFTVYLYIYICISIYLSLYILKSLKIAIFDLSLPKNLKS